MRPVVITLLLLAVVGVLAVVGMERYARLTEPFKGFAGTEQFVDVSPGSGPQTIGRLLVDSGVVSDTLTWRVALWQSGDATRLKAGEYRFDRAITVAEAIHKLARGEVYLRSLTIPEGLTIRQMARLYEGAGLGPASDFIEAAAEVTLVSGIDPAARDLEGYLFPDTYALPRRATAADLVHKMAARFETVFSPAMRERAAAANMTPREAVVLASLVEKETARSDERPLVAAVYQNRLHLRIAVRSHRHLRARARRPVHRQPHPRRSPLRFSVQHVPLRRSAARPDRLTGTRVTGGRGRTGSSQVPLLREPQRWLARVRRDA
jgi:UPF0755 protein